MSEDSETCGCESEPHTCESDEDRTVARLEQQLAKERSERRRDLNTIARHEEFMREQEHQIEKLKIKLEVTTQAMSDECADVAIRAELVGARREIAGLKQHGPTARLAEMMGLGEAVRPDIHSKVMRQRDTALAEVARLRALVERACDVVDDRAQRHGGLNKSITVNTIRKEAGMP